jgi:CubicO group peptidase (beta-lactamase class C family)
LDPLDLINRLKIPLRARCTVPRDLAEVTSIGEEESLQGTGVSRAAVDAVWRRAEDFYRTGLHPALQICIRRNGRVALNRALGHASGNAPDDDPDTPKVKATFETPICIYSAAKAITAMVIHKLDEQRVLHLEDRVCEYIPEFGHHGKQWITLRHVLGHRAGIPSLPPESIDLDLLAQPDRVVSILCDARTSTRPGRLLAYHAISGGFVLGEVVRRATGRDIRSVLDKEICKPLGFRWMNYGVADQDIERVAVNAFTGPPVPLTFSRLLRRALGAGVHEAVEISNQPRFLRGIVPSANIVSTAEELSAFYQCLLEGGALNGVRVFDPRTVQHATSEQSYREIDLTLGLPIRYGLGPMLGDDPVGLFGPKTGHAFGHIGFTNIWSWADPERGLAVALLTSGKPVLSLQVIRLFQLIIEINRAFPRIATLRG